VVSVTGLCALLIVGVGSELRQHIVIYD